MIGSPQDNDRQAILNVAASTGFFSPEEVDCVAELWDEYRQNGATASGYHFLVDRQDGSLRGFACYGPHALTEGTFDLFWIAVDKAYQGLGIGKALMRKAEEDMRHLGGRLVIVETSGTPIYEPTRAFYLAAGYAHEATLKDFYHAGDDLVVFTKKL